MPAFSRIVHPIPYKGASGKGYRSQGGYRSPGESANFQQRADCSLSAFLASRAPLGQQGNRQFITQELGRQLQRLGGLSGEVQGAPQTGPKPYDPDHLFQRLFFIRHKS
eukprot:4846915-Pyramimonas_sp.AAC.1